MIQLMILAAAAVVIFAVVYRRPAYGAALILATGPLECVLLVRGHSAVKLATMLCVGIIALRQLTADRGLRFDRTIWWMLILSNWTLLSVYWSPDLSRNFPYWTSLTMEMLLYFVLLNLIGNQGDLKIALWGHLCGGLLLTWMLVVAMVNSEFDRRVGVAGFGINVAARLIGLNILFVLLLYGDSKSFLERFLLFGIGVSGACGVLLSMSRGVLFGVVISVAAGAAVLLVRGALRVRPWQLATLASALLLIGFLASHFLTDYAQTKLMDRLHAGITLRDSAANRFEIWIVGWEMFSDHPFVGHGWHSFPILFQDYIERSGVSDAFDPTASKNPHNAYIMVLTELGVIGIVLFLGLLYSVVQNVLRLRQSDRSRTSAMAWSFALFVFLIMASLVDGLVDRKYLWYTLPIITLITRYWYLSGFVPGDKSAEDSPEPVRAVLQAAREDETWIPEPLIGAQEPAI